MSDIEDAQYESSQMDRHHPPAYELEVGSWTLVEIDMCVTVLYMSVDGVCERQRANERGLAAQGLYA